MMGIFARHRPLQCFGFSYALAVRFNHLLALRLSMYTSRYVQIQ